MKRTLHTFMLLFAMQTIAQQLKDSLRYREDQFFLDVNLLLQANNLNNFQQNGFSRSLHLGVLRDFPLNNQGNHSIALGLGYGYQRLVNSMDVYKEGGHYFFALPESNRNFRNVFSYHQLQFPLELRWRTSTSVDYDFWRIYLNYRLSYQFWGQYQPFFGRSFSLQDQYTSWQHSLGLSFGYGSWNLHFAYELLPFLKENIQNQTGGSLNFYPIHLGLIFYFL